MNEEARPLPPMNKADLETALQKTFVYHAVDNRGLMASPRQAEAVAKLLTNLVFRFVSGELTDGEITAVAYDLGIRGLTVATGAALMETVSQYGLAENTAVAQAVNTFQLTFLENLAAAREIEQQRIQERSQAALQNALHTQLKQQISQRDAQERYNHILNNILQLNTRLSLAETEESLIEAAVNGICQALNLDSVTLYTINELSQKWLVQSSTSEHHHSGYEIEPAAYDLLQKALQREGEAIRFYRTAEGEDGLSVLLLLYGGSHLFGALWADNDHVSDVDREAYLILLRTFSQNLAALWHNHYLRQETEARAHELEILYGRYTDDLWRSDQAALQARLEDNQLQIDRTAAPLPLPEEDVLPIQIGDEIFGQLHVAEMDKLDAEEQNFIQTIVREMSNALHNTRALQVAHAYSDQANRLFETGRQMSEAANERDVYRALITFAQRSDVADMALILTADPTDPDFLLSPIFWERENGLQESENRFSRDKYAFSDQLTQNELIFLEDGQSDSRLDEASRKLFLRYQQQAAVLIPLAVEGEWLGTLALIRRQSLPFSEEQLRPFLTITNQATTILANQQLLRQTETLYQLGRALTQTITRDDALDIAVREVAQYTGAHQCRFVLYDLSSGNGFVAAEAVATGISRSIELPIIGDYVYNELSKYQEPLILSENRSEFPAETIRRHVHQFGAKASLLVPSTSQQELLGFVAIDSHRGERPFTPSNIRFAQTVVDMLTTQLENIKLFDEALQRAQELITLNQIQSNIARIISMEKLAYIVYEQIGRLLDNTIFLLARYNAQTRHYRPILVIAEGQVIHLPDRTLETDELLYQFLHQEQYLCLNSADPLVKAEQMTGLDELPQSSLWVPLWQENEPTGLISVQTYHARAYNENDVQLLRSVAIQTSLAMANAELFEQIQEQNEELRELDKLKNQFLASMSHELRTPLNSIIGFSRVILKGIDGPVTPEQTEDLTAIFNNGHHLLTMINEILDMAKIEAGKMNLVFEPVDIVTLSQYVRKTIEGLVDSDKIALVWQVPEELPILEADSMRLRQILLNLLSNAVKYTEAGEIHFRIRTEEKQVHIEVEDTGIGIPAEDFDRVFTPFEQVDNSSTRTRGGTGLGLPITKWLVEMHNGRIFFESELNKGTVFHVFLPMKQSHQPQSMKMNESQSRTVDMSVL